MTDTIANLLDTVICGDVLDKLPGILSGSVHCVVTSPPYWGLRDYGVDGQLGLEKTPEEYIGKMVAVFREVWRVLRDDGVMFLNMGDSYFGGGRGGGGSYDSERPGWHEVPCGISGKEPGDFQYRGCLCENLCDVCRVVYQNHRFRNDGLLVAMLSVSLSLPIPEHKESVNGHSPTLDFSLLEDRILIAKRGLGQTSDPWREQLRAVLASTFGEFSRQLLGACLQRGSCVSCLLCNRSLSDGVREFVHKLGETPEKPRCNSGSALSDMERDNHNQNTNMACEYCISYKPQHTTELPISQVLKPKDLCGIPWRLALALQADGWYLRQDIIWHKPNPMPESVTDRCTKAHEYIFLMTKKPRYYYDTEAIKEDAKDEESYSGRKFRGPKAIIEAGGRPGNQQTIDKGCPGDGKVFAKVNKRSVWTVPTAPYSEAHFATFPPKLIEPCILAGCPEWVCVKCGEPRRRIVEASGGAIGQSWHNHEDDLAVGQRATDPASKGGYGYKKETTGWTKCNCNAGFDGGIVLDPFMGSGTVAAVAYENNRHYIGIDLNPDKQIQKRIRDVHEKYALFDTAKGGE